MSQFHYFSQIPMAIGHKEKRLNFHALCSLFPIAIGICGKQRYHLFVVYFLQLTRAKILFT